MLISTTRKFIFIANTKAASTSVERMLTKYSDVIVRNSPHKHMTYQEVVKNFEFIFDRFDINSFYKFGIIRDPIDWTISWFNYRSRPDLSEPNSQNHKNYTGHLSFDEFVDALTSEKQPSYAAIGNQSQFFMRMDGSNAMNFIINFSNFKNEIETVLEQINICEDLDKYNHNISTQKRIYKKNISEETQIKIINHFQKDYQFINQNLLGVTNERK